MKEINLDSLIIQGGCTKYVQAFDVCWHKLFKARMAEFCDQWLNEGVNQFTESEAPFQEKNNSMGI